MARHDRHKVANQAVSCESIMGLPGGTRIMVRVCLNSLTRLNLSVSCIGYL